MNEEFNLNTIVKVRVPSYDVYIPEFRVHGPIMQFMPTKIRNVINMMERGLIVEFQTKAMEFKVLDVVKRFTLVASSENERVGREVYKLPIKTQESLVMSLNLKQKHERKQQGIVSPWTNRNYSFREITVPKQTRSRAPRIPKIYDYVPKNDSPLGIVSTGYDDLLLEAQ